MGDEVSLVKFPLHQRRMTAFNAKQTGDPLSYLRELIEHIRVADWTTFNEEAAACHLFINSVRCEESKRACFKILSKSPQGDKKSLITKLQSIEVYLDKYIAIKPVLVPETCMACHSKGQSRIVGENVSTAGSMGTSLTYVGIKRRMRKLKVQNEK